MAKQKEAACHTCKGVIEGIPLTKNGHKFCSMACVDIYNERNDTQEGDKK